MSALQKHRDVREALNKAVDQANTSIRELSKELDRLRQAFGTTATALERLAAEMRPANDRAAKVADNTARFIRDTLKGKTNE